MATKIIGLVGYAGSGKDEAAKNMPGWTRVSFADPVRAMALAIDPIILIATPSGVRLSELVETVGWASAKKHEEVRRLLQRIGTEAVRDIIGKDTWLKLAKAKIGEIDGPVVITDVRFGNEAELIRSLGGKLIRIVREGVGPVNSHVSDSGIASIAVDAIVPNFGTPRQLGRAVMGAECDKLSEKAVA